MLSLISHLVPSPLYTKLSGWVFPIALFLASIIFFFVLWLQVVGCFFYYLINTWPQLLFILWMSAVLLLVTFAHAQTQNFVFLLCYHFFYLHWFEIWHVVFLLLTLVWLYREDWRCIDTLHFVSSCGKDHCLFTLSELYTWTREKWENIILFCSIILFFLFNTILVLMFREIPFGFQQNVDWFFRGWRKSLNHFS